mgnify:CR=1 FL=1
MTWKLTAAAALALSINAPAWGQAAAPATLADAPPVPAGKLTGQVQPLAYRLDLSIDPAQERFSGKTEIDATIKSASRMIDLHWRDLNLLAVDNRSAHHHRTVQAWLLRLETRWDPIRSIAPEIFTEKFRRTWLFYLGGAVETFEAAREIINCYHITFAKGHLVGPRRHATA